MTQEEELLSVLEHYELPEPGYGERPFKCPSHEDSHPSASINRTKGVWFCHACGSGGTAAQIVMDREGMTYVEAMQFISNLTGEKPATRRRAKAKRTTRWIPPALRRVTE